MERFDRFWSVICDYDRWLVLLLVANVALSTLLLISLPALESGSAAATLAVIDGTVLVVSTGSVALVLWQCRRRRERHKPELDDIELGVENRSED